jgi:hypothetical protein
VLEKPRILVCFEYRGEMEGGRTRPLLVAAIDDTGEEWRVVLKLRNPGTPLGVGHYEGTSLACELICNRIAAALEIPVPECAVVEVPRGLAETVSDRRARDVLAANIGENFGTRYYAGFDRWRADNRASSQILRDALEDVLVFDATVINGDRKREKPNLLWRGERTLAIDHSFALPVHLWTDEQIADSPLFPEGEVRQHCTFRALADQGCGFNRVLARWAETITETELDRLRGWIPATWERRPGDLDRVFRFLRERSEKAAAISLDLRRILR